MDILFILPCHAIASCSLSSSICFNDWFFTHFLALPDWYLFELEKSGSMYYYNMAVIQWFSIEDVLGCIQIAGGLIFSCPFGFAQTKNLQWGDVCHTFLIQLLDDADNDLKWIFMWFAWHLKKWIVKNFSLTDNNNICCDLGYIPAL